MIYYNKFYASTAYNTSLVFDNNIMWTKSPQLGTIIATPLNRFFAGIPMRHSD